MGQIIVNGLIRNHIRYENRMIHALIRYIHACINYQLVNVPRIVSYLKHGTLFTVQNVR